MSSGSRMDENGQWIYYDWPAADTQAQITLPANADKIWVIDRIDFGFDSIPAAAKELTVNFSGSADWALPVTSDGPHSWVSKDADYVAVRGDRETAVTITLAADTGGAKGYLNVWAHLERFV